MTRTFSSEASSSTLIGGTLWNLSLSPHHQYRHQYWCSHQLWRISSDISQSVKWGICIRPNLWLCCNGIPVWFLPRDVMRKRGHCYRRCPSVCLSVTLEHCIHTAEDIVKLLSRPDSAIILFLSPSAATQFRGNPFSGGAKYTGWEKCAIFDWNRRLSR